MKKREKLNLSSDFTIEDIHKVREHNYEITKGMTDAEKQEYYNAEGKKVHQQIQEGRTTRKSPLPKTIL